MGENLSKGCHFSHPGRNGGLRFRSNLDRDWRKCHTMRGSSYCGNRCIALFSFLRRHHSSLFCQGERSYERENLQYDRSVSLARWSCSPLAPLEKRLPTGKNITSRVRTLIRESPSFSHQSPRSGDQKRKDGGKQANDHGSGDRLVRLAPDHPRSSTGKQEDGGDRAGQ